jgi:hypothetical protein
MACAGGHPDDEQRSAKPSSCPFGERPAVTLAAHLRPNPADTLSE